MEDLDLSLTNIELVEKKGNDLVVINNVEETLFNLLTREKELKKELEEIDRQLTCFKRKMLYPMASNGIKNITTEGHNIGITYVAPIDKQKVDLKKFETEYPQAYQDYCSCLESVESTPFVKLTILKEKEKITYIDKNGEVKVKLK